MTQDPSSSTSGSPSEAERRFDFTNKDARIRLCSAMGWVLTSLAPAGLTIDQVADLAGGVSDVERDVLREYFGPNWRAGQ